MPGDIADPKKPNFDGGESALLAALARGYVVVSPAIRGRTTKNAAGRYVGKAPALIVDYKAAVRYLRAVKMNSPPETPIGLFLTARARAARYPFSWGRPEMIHGICRT